MIFIRPKQRKELKRIEMMAWWFGPSKSRKEIKERKNRTRKNWKQLKKIEK